jgi:GNAT superfamily N-acetyltransferase
MNLEPGPDHSVRLAWSSDAEQIVAIALREWQRHYDSTAELPEPAALINQWHRIIEAPPDARIRVLVALDRTAVRGAALIHPCHDSDADQVADAEIGEFLVASEHARLGHGSRLLQACVDTARADRFTRLVWWLHSTDDATRAFATSAGWGPDGAFRELADDEGHTIKQVRLHTSIA